MDRISDGPVRKQTALHTLGQTTPASTAVQEGKVIAVHPEDSTVDVALYGGQILRRVRVLFNSANTVAGFRYLASVVNNDGAQNSENGIVDKAVLTHKADTIATIVYVQGQTLAPRVIGFSLPIDSNMHIDEQGLALFKHESGVYTLIDKDGNHEIVYPDGSYIVAGSITAPKELFVGEGAQMWDTPDVPPINLTIHLAQGVDITITNKTITLSAGSASLKIDGNAGVVTATGQNAGTKTLAN